MRTHFPNLTRPFKAAKNISATVQKPLAQVQHAVAKICGYTDLFDLQANFTGEEPSILDQNHSSESYVEHQICCSLKLANLLGIPDSNAQFALSHSRLFGDRKINRQEQIQVRLGCFERTSLPPAAKRTRGAVGTLNVSGRRGEVVILRKFSGATRVISNRSVDTCVADFEYTSPKNPRKLFLPTRMYLPYGIWMEADGAQVLFSRDYLPLWRVRKDGLVERIEPWLWIKWTEEKWFWDDGSALWDSARRLQSVESILDDYGINNVPILADALPLIVHNDSIRSFSDAARALKSYRQGGLINAAE